MLHFLSFCLGFFIVLYEILHENLDILFQYSGWFVVTTSILHIVQTMFLVPSFLAYVCLSIGLFIVFPACFVSLTSFETSFPSYLLYGIGGHIFLPFFTIFHLSKITYTYTSYSIFCLLVYNTLWVLTVEYFSVKKPYEFLDNLVFEHRILSYIIISIIGVTGLLLISIFPLVARHNIINI